MRCLSSMVLVVALATAACSPPSSGSSGSGKGSGNTDHQNYPPCHPGCFPAGTMVDTPDGPKAIETIRVGDMVIVIGSAKPGSVAVRSVYRTDNRLIELQTDAGNLFTTETQPFMLVTGEFRAAGELAPGNAILRWDGNYCIQANVKGVVSTEREAPVFNLIVGDSATFVANGFLARGKPPAVE